MNNKGFTLLEVLIVVMIIGILTGIAVPNYTNAVEKSRLTEALVNSKAIVDAAQRYVQMDPTQEGESFTSANIADVQLQGGSWDANPGTVYSTKLFSYTLGTTTGTVVTVTRLTGNYLYTFTVDDHNQKTMTTSATGNKVLTNLKNFLESL